MDIITYVLAKNYANSLISQAAEGFHPKGTVATKEDLPKTATRLDMYIVADPGCKAVYFDSWVLFDVVPHKLSELENDVPYATEELVNNLTTSVNKMFAEDRSRLSSLEKSKLDKVTSTATNPRVYAVNKYGTQETVIYGQSRLDNGLVQRDALGRIEVTNGTDVNHAVNWRQLHNVDEAKVDKVEGKGLSTNDFTDELKTKLESLKNYDPATKDALGVVKIGEGINVTEDGTISVDAGGKGCEVVTFTADEKTETITADKTYKEISAILDDNKNIIGKLVDETEKTLFLFTCNGILRDVEDNNYIEFSSLLSVAGSEKEAAIKLDLMIKTDDSIDQSYVILGPGTSQELEGDDFSIFIRGNMITSILGGGIDTIHDITDYAEFSGHCETAPKTLVISNVENDLKLGSPITVESTISFTGGKVIEDTFDLEKIASSVDLTTFSNFYTKLDCVYNEDDIITELNFTVSTDAAELKDFDINVNVYYDNKTENVIPIESRFVPINKESFTDKDDVINLNPATSKTIGGIKVGAGLAVTEDGTLSATGVEVKLKTINKETLVGEGNIELPTKDELSAKQDKLIAGKNITIAEDGKTISATSSEPEKYLKKVEVDGNKATFTNESDKTIVYEPDIEAPSISLSGWGEGTEWHDGGTLTQDQVDVLTSSELAYIWLNNMHRLTFRYRDNYNNLATYASSDDYKTHTVEVTLSNKTWRYKHEYLATKADLNSKQDTLVSGTNIKTINNMSILGSGNIDVSGGGSTPTVVKVDTVDVTDSSTHVAVIDTISGSYDKVNNKVATKNDLPTKTSQLTNDSGFLTEHQSLDEYAKKSEVPTKTSQLINDSGFLTEHQSLTEYRKAADQDVIDKAAKDRLDTVESKEAGWDAKSVVSGTFDGDNWTKINIDGVEKNIPVGGGTSYQAGDGITIDGNTISTKLGHGLTYSGDSEITLRVFDDSLSSDETGVKVNTNVIQSKLTAGKNIAISEDNTISADVDLSAYRTASDQDVIDNAAKDRLTAIENKEATWDAKQDKLTAGENITIVDNVISATGGSSVKFDNKTITEDAEGNKQTTLGGWIEKSTWSFNDTKVIESESGNEFSFDKTLVKAISLGDKINVDFVTPVTELNKECEVVNIGTKLGIYTDGLSEGSYIRFGNGEIGDGVSYWEAGSLPTGTYTLTLGSNDDIIHYADSTLINFNKEQFSVNEETKEISIIKGGKIPTKTSELENDGDGKNPFLTEHQSLEAYRTNEYQDKIDEAINGRLDTIEGKEDSWDAKQEKVVAGTGIAIAADGKTISSTLKSAVLSKDLTATRSIGGIAEGDEFKAGTSIEDILIKLLAEETPVVKKYLYIGMSSSNNPSSFADLNKVEIDADTLVNSGLEYKFDMSSETEGKYIMIELPSDGGVDLAKDKDGDYYICMPGSSGWQQSNVTRAVSSADAAYYVFPTSTVIYDPDPEGFTIRFEFTKTNKEENK